MKTLLRICVVILFIPGLIFSLIIAIGYYIYTLWIAFAIDIGVSMGKRMILKTSEFMEDKDSETTKENEQAKSKGCQCAYPERDSLGLKKCKNCERDIK